MYTNSLVELDVHLSDNLCLFILLMSVWVETRRKNTYEKLLSRSVSLPLSVYAYIHIHSVEKNKEEGPSIYSFIVKVNSL
jgi:hypothetical protein